MILFLFISCLFSLSERYHTFYEVEQQLLEWDEEFGQNSEPWPDYYPNSGVIYQLSQIGVSSHDGLPIYAVKLSYNADQDNDEARVLILGQCHAEEIYGVECTMHYPERYAGTADCVGVYEGKETIIDFKQSNKPKKAEYIDSWFLQTAAYSLAHNVVYNSNINACVILVCTVDNLFQEFKIQGPELITYQNLFLGRLKKFNEMNNLV